MKAALKWGQILSPAFPTHLGDDLAGAEARGAVRGGGGGEEEAKEPLEEPVPGSGGGGGGEGRREAGDAVGGGGAAQDLEERGDGGAEGGEEAAVEGAGGGGAERRELPELARVHGEGGSAFVKHARHLYSEAPRLVGAGDGRGGAAGDMALGRRRRGSARVGGGEI